MNSVEFTNINYQSGSAYMTLIADLVNINNMTINNIGYFKPLTKVYVKF